MTAQSSKTKEKTWNTWQVQWNVKKSRHNTALKVDVLNAFFFYIFRHILNIKKGPLENKWVLYSLNRLLRDSNIVAIMKEPQNQWNFYKVSQMSQKAQRQSQEEQEWQCDAKQTQDVKERTERIRQCVKQLLAEQNNENKQLIKRMLSNHTEKTGLTFGVSTQRQKEPGVK